MQTLCFFNTSVILLYVLYYSVLLYHNQSYIFLLTIKFFENSSQWSSVLSKVFDENDSATKKLKLNGLRELLHMITSGIYLKRYV